MRKIVFLLLLGSRLMAQPSAAPLYQEKWRPQFHFTPPLHWINDPNGLVFYKGEYHLFYQHNPMGIRWGHMSWGHAVSRDLLHWQHLPLAIEEGRDVMIFSGTCVVDEKNTSGFGAPGQVPMVALYTGHQEGVNQSQHIAYSLDQGRTWTKYKQNPVLDLGKKDFRDPKVFWYEPGQYWVMAVVLPIEKQIQFYRSPNLKEWTLLSAFGPAGDVSGIWECPDLFEVPVAGEPGKKKWVLMHSPSPLMQYFVGEFDGVRFKAETDTTQIYRPDYGPDYYAAIVYNNLPKNSSPVSLGWVNNWNYANDIPVSPWRGAFSLPRRLGVKKTGNQWQLIQEPIAALAGLRDPLFKSEKQEVNGTQLLPVQGNTVEIELNFAVGTAAEAGVQVAVGQGKGFVIGYESGRQLLYIDRSAFAGAVPQANFAKLSRWEASLKPVNGKIKLRILFDRSIVEVFANDGQLAMTSLVFPEESQKGIVLYSKGGAVPFEKIRINRIKSVWK